MRQAAVFLALFGVVVSIDSLGECRDDAADRYLPGRVLPIGPDTPGGYVVVTVGLDAKNPEHARFGEVAGQVAAFHRGTVVSFDGTDFDRLEKMLKDHVPQNVLFVVPPELLDINVHRRILLLSAGLDTDIFSDFAFGYFTARDGAALKKLWQRTQEVHQHGLKSRHWKGLAVTSGMKSRVYTRSVPELARAGGFSGDSYYMGIVEADPDVLSFVDKHLPALQDAAVISLSGNGDPEGIWLFADKRNMQREKHWMYEPSKVGHDPKGEMPRLMADRWARLSLQSPVVWSGTCHAAATRRVFVEGDIVSTFGTTDRCTLHDLDPKKSLCLALLDAGAVAFLAPIGANHGYSTLCEEEFALLHGATLGETVKSTYDDVFLASRGKLRLDFQVDGDKRHSNEHVMQSGGANRILIGDPALKPFRSVPHPKEKVETINRAATGFDVVVTWEPGFHARTWDMYGVDRKRDGRIAARISLDGLVPRDRSATITAAVQAQSTDGQELSYTMKQSEPEFYHGRRLLHLQANADRKTVDRKFVKATFRVTFE